MRWIGRTVCNSPRVLMQLPNGDNLYDVCVDYMFGEDGDVEVDIEEGGTPDVPADLALGSDISHAKGSTTETHAILIIKGEDKFIVGFDEDNPKYEDNSEMDKTDEFLERIQPFLIDDLIIHTIAALDYRFPFLGAFWIVPAGGTPEDIIHDNLPASMKVFEEEGEEEEEDE